ncbi:2-amino-4-hydroxy-6-hydroxymethyldihydropteridine diphosphokinase [Humitalea rosea]|uniref:2-amino-4-hydroxy-6-hydroxymethyldihydropteridine pyrophosphokinase n=1 Tax=Humitalea rosea TaxID=990373 RepID=A0A2W7JF97_9PROT|nr:2-amino-4-hydroxy-6-hydroxymethyldihydropteridine diphosphokinase [Humitalea rosea]PZW51167.1 2-amino-4-hydroxy-6-hydroxymethyldihydropteridine diphosphokinase [Humitalea rosea]
MRSDMILVALGANLPGPDGAPPAVTLTRAVAALEALPGLRRVTLSRFWQTPSEPPGSPDYVNAVLRLAGEVEPVALLAATQAIEAAAGRIRPWLNAPRTLDLDLIAIGDLLRAAPDPILPHPRAHLRRFVLVPLAEVAPDWRHPVTGATAAEMLALLAPVAMRPLVV